MATIKMSGNPAVHGLSAYGNVWSGVYSMSTNSSGVIVESDLATAVQSGDIVELPGLIPAGTKLTDAVLLVSDAFTTSTTAKVGFKYADGVDSTAVPQDDDYFFVATATDSTGLTRKTTVTRPVILPKDAKVILTIGGAAHAAAGVLDVVLTGLMVGFK